ncbi:hypothetical protein BKA56DRAFT_491781 [Ilyonectria sp. MPI-CAGE-AT-0026]|nr:hypothetical protein BKA56DRAFT_491781 [Ilyonectria sp. MPI-CAGE-AT-0026]
MNPLFIQAWVDEMDSSPTAYPVDPTLAADPLPDQAERRSLSDERSSPAKRPRTSEYPAFHPDSDEAPASPQPQPARHDCCGGVIFDPLTGPTISFPDLIASQEPFSPPISVQQAPTVTSYTTDTTRSGRPAPTKRSPKMPSLLSLARPVRFQKESDLGRVLPCDARALFDYLSAVEAKEEILPAALRDHVDFRDPRVRDFMWEPTPVSEQPNAEDEATLLANHARIRGIVDDSIASSNLNRSEDAWNCLVHAPVLRHALSRFASLDVEPISSAQVMPRWRPFLKYSHQDLCRRSHTSASSASSASEQDSGKPRTPKRADVSSLRKMVDFSVVLRPRKQLQKLIDEFLDRQPYGMTSISQTLYEPLRTRPAPIFIETNTPSSNMDTANVQLGLWVAAWHQHTRMIIALGRPSGDVTLPPPHVLTLPVIRVMGSVWTLLFAVEAGNEIHMLDGNFRIGDTNSITGVYQLQAAISVLAGWIRTLFEPWFYSVLACAT